MTDAIQEHLMNSVADVALIISLSCSGGAALAEAVSPMTAGKAAMSFPIDLSVIRDEAGVTAASQELIGFCRSWTCDQ
jgi:hypothetical protein